MDDLTPRQWQVLHVIREQLARAGYPPTLREIAGQLGISGTLGVMKHLAALERKGYLRKEAGNSRAIVLTDPTGGTAFPKNRSRSGHDQEAPQPLPVVGVVRAGTPQPPMEDIEEYISVDRSIARAGGTFFLRVKGDSMINAAIVEGDLALVRPQPTAENRDIVVAMVEGEATLKRFYRERSRIRLQPENPNMQPIIVNPGDELAIIGKVVGIYRRLA